MNTIDWVANSLGVVNVALVVRRSLWNYPIGIAMVTLYAVIFYRVKLYSDALLQIFFSWLMCMAGGNGWSRAGKVA